MSRFVERRLDGMMGRKISNYRELPPPPELAGYLTCLWCSHTGADDDGLHNRVLPDGCIDIVWIGDTAPKIAGPATEPVIARLPPKSPIAGARFRPGMASTLLGAPAHELLNMDVMLRDVWGASADRLTEVIEPGAPVRARLEALREALVARLPDAGPADDTINQAVAILASDPAIQVQDLSRSLDIGQRQLLRRFSAAVGYGPKTFGRILRFQHALHVARRPGHAGVDFATLAFDAGYADQAHMTREFSRLAGVTPSTLLSPIRQPAEMSDSFKPAISASR